MLDGGLQLLPGLQRRGRERQVRQEDIAHSGAPVPLEHGVDSLGQLSAARLVDAAGIDPSVLESTPRCLQAGPINLLPPDLGRPRSLSTCRRHHLLEGDFLAIDPRVRENGVAWNFVPNKLPKPSGVHVDEPHRGRSLSNVADEGESSSWSEKSVREIGWHSMQLMVLTVGGRFVIEGNLLPLTHPSKPATLVISEMHLGPAAH